MEKNQMNNRMKTETGSFDFYAEQYFRFKDYEISIDTRVHVRRIIAELVHHFKLPEAKVEFKKNQLNAAYLYPQKIFCFPDNKNRGITLVEVCHEVAHHFQYSKFGNPKHDKELFHIMEQMLLYCKKHNYWRGNFGKNKRDKLEQPCMTNIKTPKLSTEKTK
jgi:hypothetical protein